MYCTGNGFRIFQSCDEAVLCISEKLCKALKCQTAGSDKLNAGNFALGVEVDRGHRQP